MKLFFDSRLIVIAALAWAPVALASNSFPFAIHMELNLTADPPCTICHASLEGGLGSVNKPFGRAMMDAGAKASDTTLLIAALKTLEAAGTDSDGDKVPDIQELKDGTDPNPASSEGPSLQYGCSTSGFTGGLALCLLATLLLTRRARAAR